MNKTPEILHQHLSAAGKKGAARQPREAKVAGGIAGSKARWADRKICPTCRRTATEEQIRNGTAILAHPLPETTQPTTQNDNS